MKSFKIFCGRKKITWKKFPGGRIDHAHHATLARLALDETVEFHKAVEAIIDQVNLEDTLIVVTADHSHTMSVGGYPVIIHL